MGLTQSSVPGSRSPRVILWGTGNSRREFLHVDDMAAACVFLMMTAADSQISDTDTRPISFLNIGTGKDATIREVSKIINDIVGFSGETVFNPDQPDGTPQKLLDTRKISNLGWKPEYGLRDGLKHAYQWYCTQISKW
jgi:GDP-L-fucose synthase